MDINSPRDISVSEEVNRILDSNQSGVREAVSLSNLGDGLTECLHTEDGEISASDSTLVPTCDKNDISNVEREDTLEKPCKTELSNVTSDECLCKCKTVPSSSETNSTASAAAKEKEDGDQLDEITTDVLKENGDGSKKPAYHSTPLPTPLKLVSAMKGSREKRGVSPKKLTVKWAPDVYDPPPSAASHVPTNKKQRHKSDNKRNGKNKQKGKRGKDKKQVRKSGGTSNKSYQTLDSSNDHVIQYDDAHAQLGGFDLNIQDSYCGSSFLKKSVGKIHFSVAEAT